MWQNFSIVSIVGQLLRYGVSADFNIGGVHGWLRIKDLNLIL